MPELRAEVTVSEESLVITNKDGFDWSNVKVTLNPKIMGSGYSCHVACVPHGKTVHIPFHDLTKGDGTRFNIYATRPKTVDIEADTPYGHARYFGGWK
jgi:hypothetical protein